MRQNSRSKTWSDLFQTNAYRVEKGLRSASKTRTSVAGVVSEKLNMTI